MSYPTWWDFSQNQFWNLSKLLIFLQTSLLQAILWNEKMMDVDRKVLHLVLIRTMCMMTIFQVIITLSSSCCIHAEDAFFFLYFACTLGGRMIIFWYGSGRFYTLICCIKIACCYLIYSRRLFRCWIFAATILLIAIYIMALIGEQVDIFNAESKIAIVLWLLTFLFRQLGPMVMRRDPKH